MILCFYVDNQKRLYPCKYSNSKELHNIIDVSIVPQVCFFEFPSVF